mmetsp:Transcript_22217/g.28406  ORF Transcript_22217/g.28406 Transcript_22217/m.28406 type:complete len:350 (+) Transcript_22217:1-1050(+)
MALTDLGDFHYARGDMENALKRYARTRDYCTNSPHIIAMCLNVIRVCIESKKFTTALNYIPKAEQVLKQPADKVIGGKLKAAAGLAALSNKKYYEAAEFLISIPSELSDKFSDIIAAEDIALYGGICSLATFSRQELKKKVIENPTFRSFLELSPRVRELIHSFHESNYASLLNLMKDLETDIKLDIYLSQHLTCLYQQIRDRALIQYVSPYSSVCLKRMSKIFQTDVNSIESELAKLIMGDDYERHKNQSENESNKSNVQVNIQARIDSHNKVLFARHADDDQRQLTYLKALQTGEDFCLEAHASILRINLGRAGITYEGVENPKSQSQSQSQTSINEETAQNVSMDL